MMYWLHCTVFCCQRSHIITDKMMLHGEKMAILEWNDRTTPSDQIRDWTWSTKKKTTCFHATGFVRLLQATIAPISSLHCATTKTPVSHREWIRPPQKTIMLMNCVVDPESATFLFIMITAMWRYLMNTLSWKCHHLHSHHCHMPKNVVSTMTKMCSTRKYKTNSKHPSGFHLY